MIRCLQIKQSYNMDHDQLTDLAMKESPGCEGVTFLPYLAGERTPNWPHASGAVVGLRPGLLRPGLLYRAAMEGATFSLLAGLRQMQVYGVEASQLLVVGGGSKNALWRRILADAFQLPLSFPAEPESAALGAALQAGAIANEVPVYDFVRDHQPALEEESLVPDGGVADEYHTAFTRFTKWGANMFGGGTCDV